MTSIFAEQVLEAVRSVVSLSASDAKAVLHAPEFTGREREYVMDAIDSTFVSSVGAYVDRFEKDLADICGVKRAVAVVNGTAALHVAFLLAGVRPGDEVLTPALTFVATANAIAYCSATPHFVDSEMTSLGMDPAALATYLATIAERRIDGAYNRLTGKRIAAMVPVHTFGLPCDIEELVVVANKWGIVLVEDAAESLGSERDGRALGGRGFIGAMSFNGNKIVTTGGGGALLTNDEKLAQRAKHITTTAKIAHRWNFVHDMVGFNYRMPNINAALGVAQLEQLPAFLTEKRALADAYKAAFAEIPGVTFVSEPGNARSNYWLNCILVENQEIRDEILLACNDNGLMVRPAWTLMPDLTMYANCPSMPIPVARGIGCTLINIPSSAYLGRPHIRSTAHANTSD